jgi:cytochrome c-type biogenesis protein CcmE
MAEMTWEKSTEQATEASKINYWVSRGKYLIIGLGLLSIVGYLIFTGMATGRYYITVDELVADSSKIDKDVRVSGAVVGESIRFDPDTQVLSFTVVNIPSDGGAIKDAGGLGAVLHYAVNDPEATRMQVVWENAELPDLLQHEAQAIMSGRLGEDGVFYANEVLLKCPTKYSDEVPQQVMQQ